MTQKAVRDRGGVPARRRPLGRLIGAWRIRGRTSDSRFDNISGTTNITWSVDGCFLEQRSILRVGPNEMHALEIVAGNGKRGTFPSWVFSSGQPKPITYRWIIRGNSVQHSGLGWTFRGRISRDGRTIVGRWQADRGNRRHRGNTYDAVMTRVRAH